MFIDRRRTASRKRRGSTVYTVEARIKLALHVRNWINNDPRHASAKRIAEILDVSKEWVDKIILADGIEDAKLDRLLKLTGGESRKEFFA